jgi:hypothetical protein
MSTRKSIWYITHSMTPFQQKQLILMRQMESSLASGASSSSVVPFQTDYAHDTRICLTAVSFLSNTLANIIQNRLIATLKTIEPDFYYYPNESMHITIQNIRSIHNPPNFDLNDINKAKSLFTDFFATCNQFPIILQGVIQMPTSLAVIVLMTKSYDTCIRTLRQQLISNGIYDDKQYFTDEIIFANCTICRYSRKPSQKFIQMTQTGRDELFGNGLIQSVSLIQSNAVMHPSKTTIIKTYNLR